MGRSQYELRLASLDQITKTAPNPRLEIQSVMLVFSTPLVNKRPSIQTFSLVDLPPLPCVNKNRVMYSYSV
jgi:hypothetical protein